MKRGKIVLVHIGLFIVLSILLFFLAEPILNVVAPGFHTVEMWIALIIFGILGVFIVLLISCLVFLMKNKAPRLGILAFGSLVDYPGSELKKYIVNRIDGVETPFKVEYGRKSSKRGNAPTLIPVSQGGNKVKATLLILSNELGIAKAKDMLYRRELNEVGSDKTYTERKNPTPNQLVIETFKNIRNVQTVLTAKFGPNLPEITPEILANLAIGSYKSNDVELGRDGISYLNNNISNGIVTPLTEKYKNLILQKMDVTSLDELLKKRHEIKN